MTADGHRSVPAREPDRQDSETSTRLAQAVAAGTAAAGEEGVDDDGGEELMGFRIQGRGYAVRVGQVREVMAVCEVTAVPHTPPHIKGVVNRHGLVTAVFDLAIFRGSESDPTPSRFVVIESDELEAAIPVSEVIGLLSVGADQIHPTVGGERGGVGVVGELSVDDEVLTILDSKSLLSSSRLDRQEGAGA